MMLVQHLLDSPWSQHTNFILDHFSGAGQTRRHFPITGWTNQRRLHFSRNATSTNNWSDRRNGPSNRNSPKM